MRFRITGLCPFQESELTAYQRREILALLPLTIRIVKKPAHPPPNGCTLKKYRVPNAVANKVRAKIGLQPEPYRDFSVCEHMGHVIE